MSKSTLSLSDVELMYPYSVGDKLEERNTYFYSRYYGENFFNAWRIQRSNAFFSCKETVDTSRLFVSLSDENINLFGNKLPKFTVIETGSLLNVLMAAQIKYSTDSSTFPFSRLLSQFVKKFEVSKRVHEEYKGQELLIDGCPRYHNLLLYVKAAYVFLTAYKDTLGLQFLNAFLKIIDTLCSIVGQSDSLLIREHLPFLIDSEATIIKMLLIDAGVNYDEK